MPAIKRVDGRPVPAKPKRKPATKAKPEQEKVAHVIAGAGYPPSTLEEFRAAYDDLEIRSRRSMNRAWKAEAAVARLEVTIEVLGDALATARQRLADHDEIPF
ncbi:MULTISPECIES: hypothetical protein [unclassified Mesorhizobium]|uniref:hypothetical protein n=1 Tax=unclassified Mesorhizobium TaxID=325217 RepID=UPI00112967F2|nr:MULTISPECIES: hypothetical protein [unclassified Mesorhizobium]TPM06775.1 hypothetical protein FJ939_11975 [Mesorhizobium sp. B2-3-8]TPM15342.1 hypothetical protein FJ940_14130 [Mesorhizobium sp. B2-3-7]